MQERLDVRAFLWLVAIAAALSAGVFFLHRYQIRHNASELRELAQTVRKERPDRAARLLGLYLSFYPADIDARADYGSLLEALAVTAKGRQAAVETYEEVLARDPARKGVRKSLASLLIEG